MLHFEEIQPKQILSGVEHEEFVEVIVCVPVGSGAATLIYKKVDGSIRERLLSREDENSLFLAQNGKPWSFDAPADEFKLAAEAYRIHLAHLFDPMMAVHTSNVQPLPHQITAVYESMLPRQPLRFVLADDPGAGKTIMAGLLIRELIMRSDAKRVLIVSPGSLTEQWQEEMSEKFGLHFDIFGRQMLDQSQSGNPFDDSDLLIARLDQLSRAEDIQEKLSNSSWDLVVVDEAHKLSASFFGNKVNETKRFKLGKLLGERSRHFLLMTATPHNGKEEDFQLFLSLLDSDRFYGKFREGRAQKVDVSDIMRRMVKEELLKFDGTPLFPERKAYALNYQLSSLEKDLYDTVTRYVREEMGKADALQKGHCGRVGFALTALQRRLASSPEAIFQTLQRRKKRLEATLKEMQQRHVYTTADIYQDDDMTEDAWDAEDSMSADEFEVAEERLVDQATASQTATELQAEILLLADLEKQAKEVVDSGKDRKWDELSHLLQENEAMHDSAGNQRKLIIFTEYKDTLQYLYQRISNLLGNPDAVIVIHGGVNRDARKHAQDLFRNDKQVTVLIATDAAGEGVNLQNANLMVNYDLPWNPNRLEQRFGRIHRIGQQQTCHLWNLIASQTREGDVFQKLFEKLEVERNALGGRVFDILGEIFEEKSLKDLLIEAIRYGEEPERMEKLKRKIEGAMDQGHIKEIMERNALCQEIMSQERLFLVKEAMDKAEARKLQPYYIRTFFLNAFQSLHGTLYPRESLRYEITNVPRAIKDRGEQLRKKQSAILSRYQRVCFEKEQIQLPNKVGALTAELIHPGHPLMLSVLNIILETKKNILKQGTVLVDPSDFGTTPRMLFIIDHSIKEEKDQNKLASRRMHFVEISEDGSQRDAGWAPYLSYSALSSEHLAELNDILQAEWISKDVERMALDYAIDYLVPEHFTEIQQRRTEQANKIRDAVRLRLAKEISYQQDLLFKYQEDAQRGRDMRLKIENIHRILEDLKERRDLREVELDAMKRVVSATPIVLGGALIIPIGLLYQRNIECAPTEDFSQDAVARAYIEQCAMQAVIQSEEAKGYTCIDVSKQNCGWDITSIPPKAEQQNQERHIEVKGRSKGSTVITVTHNEICSALNQGDKFWLAIVFVDGNNVAEPIYIQQPFTQAPEMGVASVNYTIADLLKKKLR